MKNEERTLKAIDNAEEAWYNDKEYAELELLKDIAISLSNIADSLNTIKYNS